VIEMDKLDLAKYILEIAIKILFILLLLAIGIGVTVAITWAAYSDTNNWYCCAFLFIVALMWVVITLRIAIEFIGDWI
jgi:membrane protein YdbS with pleckstrin-like domain